MDNRPIGVFDSGVGGLSILRELHKILPNENFVFLADQKNVPYGEKTKKELVGFMYGVANYLTKEHDIKMFVIACNTATCYTIKELRQKYQIPLVGTEPALKPAALYSKTGEIAVISTPATSKSKTIKKLIRDYCQNVKVLNIGCKNLEDTVERGDLNSREVEELLGKYLNEVKDSNADQLVLGCTHYPFLRQTIGNMLGKKVNLVDSGQAIAHRSKFLLLQNKIKNTKNKKGSTLYFTTGPSEKFSKVASKLLKKSTRSKKVKI